jgi:hypothetical protein
VGTSIREALRYKSSLPDLPGLPLGSADYFDNLETAVITRGGEMGAALIGVGVSALKGLFKKKAKKAIAKVATNVASNLATQAINSIGGSVGTAIQQYRGANDNYPAIPGASFPAIPPAQGWGSTGGTIVQGIINTLGAGSPGTAITRHPGAMALPDGTIWYHGRLYVLRTNGRLQRVTRNRQTGQIVPAPKSINVLNPHALHRSMRRVEGFHHVATSALKHMEKWARKASHRRAPPGAPRGKKK